MNFCRLTLVLFAFSLAACQGDESYRSTRHVTPIPPATLALMSSKKVSAADPILMRAYKKESEIELWKRGSDGQYALLKTYPMCRWSGQLGPKTREGDRQAPEGFYDVTPGRMNPNSSLFLSFDVGYPNAYDRSRGHTGSNLMVHGSCSSRGCFAMTDEAIAEIYAIAREAFAGGQRSVQFQSYPFRMTPENLAKHRADPNIAFWQNLKEGSDRFEITKFEPKVSVAGGRYAFDEENRDAAVAAAVRQKKQRDDAEVAELVAKGQPAIRLVYGDGGGHESFRDVALAMSGGDSSARVDDRTRRSLGDVSRPDALAQAPLELPADETNRPTGGAPGLKKLTGVEPPRVAKPIAPARKPDEPILVAAIPAEASGMAPASGEPARPFYKRMLSFLPLD